jgi:hypothetical protein
MPPRQLALFPAIPHDSSDEQLTEVLGSRLPVAIEVLGEISDHRYGILAGTDRVMRFIDTLHVRHALDVEDLVALLIAHGIVTVPEAAEPVMAIHGSVPRPVCLLAVTDRGGLALRRWIHTT